MKTISQELQLWVGGAVYEFISWHTVPRVGEEIHINHRVFKVSHVAHMIEEKRTRIYLEIL